MANSIRTPRQGLTQGSRRIAQAVDNEEWQKFRVSLKGKSTAKKLQMLSYYYYEQAEHTHPLDSITPYDMVHCDVCIRVDNYIKALCRGGQLFAGESLGTAVNVAWNLPIKKN